VIVEIGLVALALALGAGVALSVLKHRYDGRFRRTHHLPAPHPKAVDPRQDGEVLTTDDLGAALGERVTLVQFSSAFCAPCRATHRILADVAGMVDGVTHVEIDAESNLELVRRIGILRTPTVLVLDRTGHVVTRASGQPRTVDVIAAVGRAVDHAAA